MVLVKRDLGLDFLGLEQRPDVAQAPGALPRGLHEVHGGRDPPARGGFSLNPSGRLICHRTIKSRVRNVVRRPKKADPKLPWILSAQMLAAHQLLMDPAELAGDWAPSFRHQESFGHHGI
jgi:hypothetical protein